MKKSYLMIFVLLALFCFSGGATASLMPINPASIGTAWNGTTDTDWYNTTDKSFTVTTPEQLAGLAQIVNGTALGITADNFSGKTVALGADLDLGGVNQAGDWSGMSWTPIGASSTNSFAGTFKGNNKHITNFYINNDGSYQALFGYTAATARITNLFIDSGYLLTTGSSCAAFVASNNGFIINCKNAASVEGTGGMGGITSANSGFLVRVSNSGAVVSSGSNVGGISASNSGTGKLIQCCNSGTVTSTALRVAGIVGNNTGSISGAYNTGAVSSSGTGTTNIGGLVGTNNGSVSYAYNGANVTGNGTRVGAIGGSGGSYTGCFYLKTDTVNNSLFSVGSSTGATADTTGTAAKDASGLKNAETVTALASAFVADSTNLNNGYPVFSWQVSGAYPDDEIEGLDIAAKPTDMTGSSFKVTMNRLLLYTTLSAADFKITANVEGEESNFTPTGISQTNTDTVTTVTFTFPSVHAEKTAEYTVQYKNGTIFSSDTFTTPATENWIDYFVPSFDGGTGTAADPYQIRTAEQLAYFGKTTDNYEDDFFVLTDDIDLSAKLWTPKTFNGCFDGQGHAVNGLRISQTVGSEAGLFGSLNNRTAYSTTYKYVSYVANLRIIEPTISSTVSYTGALAGQAGDVNIINCSVDGGTISGKITGGFVGYYSPSSYVGTSNVSRCSSTATIQGTSCGGLIGYASRGNSSYGSIVISDCFSGGSVSGTVVGGIVGGVKLVQGITIDHCFSTATVSGTGDYVGGLVGYGDLSGQSNVYMGADGISIRNSVALNPSISTTSTKDTALKGRIIANGDTMIAANKGTFANNYGYELTLVNGVYAAEDETSNGKNLSSETSYAQNFWKDTLGFDFDSFWSWSGDTNYPQLKGDSISDVYAISFSLQPHDATAYRTKAATFGVNAAGGLSNYTYQWQSSTDNGATWKNIDTATEATLSIGYQDGYASDTLLRCLVTDSSNNKATSDSAKLTVVTSKYMPDDALKGILNHYKNKGTLNSAGDAFALSAAGKDLSDYSLNLPAHYTYFGHSGATSVDGYSVNDSFYFPWIMMDLYALGEDPQNYVVTSNGNNNAFNIFDLYLNDLQNSTTGGFESHISTPGTVITNEYALPSIITGLEMYFDGKAWGNESNGTKLGRDGAIEYAFSLLKDDASGGKTYSTLRTSGILPDSVTLALTSQRAQCEFVLLMVRLSDDPVYGTQAREALSDVLKAMEAFYDDAKLTSTETGGYYVSALIGAASVTDNYFKRIGYLNLADEIMKDILVGSQSVDGGYSAAIGTSGVTADGHATTAMMMALSDYNNESASLATFTYTIKDADAVSNDLAALSLPTTVTGDLTLPTSGSYGSAITWITSDKNAITTTGKVNRTSVDVPVTLTATVKKGDDSQSKTFHLTVKADADADTDAVDAALNAVTIPEETISNLTIPASTVDGVSFAWASSNGDILATDGTVTRPAKGSDNVTVTLTLTATKSNVTKTREYPVLVYADNTGYMEAYHTGRAYYLANRTLNGYWNVFAAYALLGDFIQDPANGYKITLAQPDGSWYGTQYGATVLAICAMGENPYDYNGVNYVDLVKKNYGGPYAATTFCQLAMVAAGADSSYYIASPAAGISMTKPSSMTAGVDIAGWASEILAIYAGQAEVDTAVTDYIQYLKTMGVETSGNFTNQNCISTSCVVSGLAALYAAGYNEADPTGTNWTNTTSGKNVLDVLYDDYIVDGKFPSYLTQGYMALGDAINAKNGGTSAWIACGVSKAKLQNEITKAETLLANEDLYTADSVDVLKITLTAAQAVSNDRLNANIADYGEEYF
ncbi:MAG TPA: hypothetical protein PKD52_12485, partial [Clostridiales bacterium]|nr:hypothetical protein [Clostridiales bacterium]